MPLKTLVKVGNITNLSDARYCAGMGVDFLGFSVIPGQPNYLSVQLFQEIRGWISGPKVVAEVNGITDVSILQGIIEGYAADYLEMDFAEYIKFGKAVSLPAMVRLSPANIAALSSFENNILYWIVDEATLPGIPMNFGQILCTVTSKDSIERVLSHHLVKGIVLYGSDEQRPGFKEYDSLADILEGLEE